MAKHANYPASWLTLRQQRRGIVKWTPFLSCRIRRGILVCEGVFQPTALSRKYVVRISYRLGLPPIIHVITPALKQHADWNHIPHLHGDGSLCLYFPDLREWGPRLHIAKSIVPWTALWLFYYEAWLATGELGGWGGHPAPVNHREFIDRPRLLSLATLRAASWGALKPYHSSLHQPGSRRLLRALSGIQWPSAA